MSDAASPRPSERPAGPDPEPEPDPQAEPESQTEPQTEPGPQGGDERLRVLRMVARGTLSPEEAAGLLAALDPPPAPAWLPLPPAMPIPPVPPVPPLPPRSPVPPVPPFRGASGARFPFAAARPAQDWLIQVPGPPGPPGPQVPAPRRTLVISINNAEGSQMEARVPLEMGGAGKGLIPRQVREGLDEHEIELGEILDRAELLAGTPPGETVVSVQGADGSRLSISVE